MSACRRGQSVLLPGRPRPLVRSRRRGPCPGRCGAGREPRRRASRSRDGGATTRAVLAKETTPMRYAVGRLRQEVPDRLLRRLEPGRRDILRRHRARGVDGDHDRRVLARHRDVGLRSRECARATRPARRGGPQEARDAGARARGRRRSVAGQARRTDRRHRDRRRSCQTYAATTTGTASRARR